MNYQLRGEDGKFLGRHPDAGMYSIDHHDAWCITYAPILKDDEAVAFVVAKNRVADDDDAFAERADDIIHRLTVYDELVAALKAVEGIGVLDLAPGDSMDVYTAQKLVQEALAKVEAHDA